METALSAIKHAQAYIEHEEIKPLVASIHPLSAIVATQQEFLTKRHTGKIVLIP